MQQLSIQISEEYIFLVKITVFDAHHKIIEPVEVKPEQLKFKLQPGLYTLRTEMNGEVKDEVFWFDKKQTIQVRNATTNAHFKTKNIQPPKQYSSALLTQDYAFSPDYYTEAAVGWSAEDTVDIKTPRNKKRDSSLFLFMRFSSNEHFEKYKKIDSKKFWSNYELLNEKGSSIFSFESGNGLEIDNEKGCFALNVELPSGVYYLHCKGGDERQIPIYLFKSWNTQFFMILGEDFNYGTIRIFLSKARTFNPQEKTHQYIDLLLDKLQNGDFTLEPDLVKMVAHGKYESPILGLLCSYIYLNSKAVQDDELFRMILNNLQNVILKNNQESPDFRALTILAANHFSDIKFKNAKVNGTPMFRAGYDAILSSSMSHKRLIPQNSINDFISENRYFDSPFNTFKPVSFSSNPKFSKQKAEEPEPVKQHTDFERKANATTTRGMKSMSNTVMSSAPIKGTMDTKNIKDILPLRTLNYIKKQGDSIKQNSWLKASIAGLVIENKSISVRKISQKLCIPTSTVNRVFKEWQNELG